MVESPSCIPKFEQSVNGKHYSYNCYSITMRDGCGINLGSRCHTDVLNWFNSQPHYAVLSIEKSDKAAHYQGGVFFLSPVRQDHLRSKLMEIFESLNWNENQKKHALKIIPHKEPDVLFRYCSKEAFPLIWKYRLSPSKLRGCTCSVKNQICRYCDPHRFSIPLMTHNSLWTHVEADPRCWSKILHTWDGDLDARYGPLMPTAFFQWLDSCVMLSEKGDATN